MSLFDGRQTIALVVPSALPRRDQSSPKAAAASTCAAMSPVKLVERPVQMLVGSSAISSRIDARAWSGSG
jgi:hypothetical protein